jgi:hypothetical protein
MMCSLRAGGVRPPPGPRRRPFGRSPCRSVCSGGRRLGFGRGTLLGHLAAHRTSIGRNPDTDRCGFGVGGLAITACQAEAAQVQPDEGPSNQLLAVVHAVSSLLNKPCVCILFDSSPSDSSTRSPGERGAGQGQRVDGMRRLEIGSMAGHGGGFQVIESALRASSPRSVGDDSSWMKDFGERKFRRNLEAIQAVADCHSRMRSRTPYCYPEVERISGELSGTKAAGPDKGAPAFLMILVLAQDECQDLLQLGHQSFLAIDTIHWTACQVTYDGRICAIPASNAGSRSPNSNGLRAGRMVSHLID